VTQCKDTNCQKNKSDEKPESEPPVMNRKLLCDSGDGNGDKNSPAFEVREMI
jgi:hypothetical protein